MAAMACEQEGTSGAAPASEGHSHHSGNKARSEQVLKLLVEKIIKLQCYWWLNLVRLKPSLYTWHRISLISLT
jgi:hypothetical protein